MELKHAVKPSLAPLLDIPKCIKMCLFHDTAESPVGDLTPVDRVPKTEKHPREAGTEIVALWREFEDGESLEGRFVRDLARSSCSSKWSSTSVALKGTGI
ncbi:hypothetical protein VTI74DRAFT_11491 [Chaetomium olivicolor]